MRSTWLTLFDSAFLGLYLIDRNSHLTLRKCVNPFSFKNIHIFEDEVFEKIADLNMFAFNVSILDGLIDGHLKSRFFKVMFEGPLEKNFERLNARIDDLRGHVFDLMETLQNESSLVQVQRVAQILGTISSRIFEDGSVGKIVENMVILQYLLDAFEDYDSDLKKNRSNPLFLHDRAMVPRIVERVLLERIEELKEYSIGCAFERIIVAVLEKTVFGRFARLEGRWRS